MITKEQCVSGVKVTINNKVTRWNQNMNTKNNGLICFEFSEYGVLPGNEIEISPNTEIEILSKPKRFNENGNQVKFKYGNSETIMSAWWCNFKHKVDLK
jgi:hypothetical protein